MTNLVFFSYGIEEQTRRMIDELSTLKFPFISKDVVGNNVGGWMQGNLRPVQLWVYSFPKGFDNLENVIRTLKPVGLPTKYSNLDKYGSILRYGLHLEKLPEIKPDGKFFPLVKERFPDVSIIPVGFSHDVINELGNENV